jgi:hypothetical protein
MMSREDLMREESEALVFCDCDVGFFGMFSCYFI